LSSYKEANYSGRFIMTVCKQRGFWSKPNYGTKYFHLQRGFYLSPYGIGGSCMDKIIFSVLWHNRWIAQLWNKSTTPTGRAEWIVQLKTESPKKKRSCVAAARLACMCEIKQNFPGFTVLSLKKGLCHWIACLILDTASNCCCTADVYRVRLVHLYVWFFLLHGQDLIENVDKFQSGTCLLGSRSFGFQLQ